MQIQKVIEQLGYSPNEAKVYLASLLLGAAHISDISSKSKLPRSTAQVSADKLHKNGLMNFYVQHRYKYWVAENPEKLLQQLQEQQESVKAAMPALSALCKNGKHLSISSAVKIFNDYHEAKFIFDDILAMKLPVLALFPQDCFFDIFAKHAVWQDFENSRVERNLHMQALVPSNKQGEVMLLDQEKKLRRVRVFSPQLDIKTAIFIYGDKVALVMCNGVKPMSVLIEDPGMSRTQTTFFEKLWDSASVKKM